MIRQILEECQQGFNEVVLMLSNEVTTAEVYMMLNDLRFNEKGDIATFMADDETHLHMYMDRVKEVQFQHRQNEQGQPSYSVWFMDQNQEPVLRIYLRKSEQEETNQPRHDLFMGLLEKYGAKVQVGV
ncbi:MAG: ChuX/HutX family heme-like substrate-binding protein [Dehalococcoidia bacterium]